MLSFAKCLPSRHDIGGQQEISGIDPEPDVLPKTNKDRPKTSAKVNGVMHNSDVYSSMTGTRPARLAE
jgi:hypothetical protein